MTNPIKPSEVVSAKRSSIPDFVIEAFNRSIGENWNGFEASFAQEAVIAKIRSRWTGYVKVDPSSQKAYVYSQKWLDVEDIFRKAGWEVEYDKPGYNESGPAVFRFRKAKREGASNANP